MCIHVKFCVNLKKNAFLIKIKLNVKLQIFKIYTYDGLHSIGIKFIVSANNSVTKTQISPPYSL
jgi:hypothetical protein